MPTALVERYQTKAKHFAAAYIILISFFISLGKKLEIKSYQKQERGSWFVKTDKKNNASLHKIKSVNMNGLNNQHRVV